MSYPTAFISYAWEDDPKHMACVREFATRLRRDYIDAKLDQWEAIPGDQLPVFMEREISNNDFVLVICTPAYKKKSEARHGGVGYEGDVITSEVFRKQNHRKFIPVLLKGEWDESAPSWMQGKLYIDFRKLDYSGENYKSLLITLKGQNEGPPPLGSEALEEKKAITDHLTLADNVRVKTRGSPLEIEPGQAIHLPAEGAFSRSAYIFSQDEVYAVQVALASARPLIVIAEPGMDENDLARAVAIALDRSFIRFRVSAKTEVKDLLWKYDPNDRLIESQLVAQRADIQDVKEALAVDRFVEPGPMWWALDWQSAQAQQKNVGGPALVENGENGSVLYLEAIDRAEAEVLLDLLDIFANSAFSTPDNKIVKYQSQNIPPLIIMSSNLEKELPAAFVRKCVVLQLRTPVEKDHLIDWLLASGKTHFPATSEQLLMMAAQLVVEERFRSKEDELEVAPGKSEYLDLLRAVITAEGDLEKQMALLDITARYTVRGKLSAE